MTYHDCYRKVYRLIRDRDKTLSVIFDDPSGSTAFIMLGNMIAEGLLTREELELFSPEAQERIEVIKSCAAHRLVCDKRTNSPKI